MGAQEEAHLPKASGPKFKGAAPFPGTAPGPRGRRAVGAASPDLPPARGVKDENQTSPQPPPLPFPASLIFFSTKICLCHSSLKAWSVNMWSRGRETPGLKALLPPPRQHKPRAFKQGMVFSKSLLSAETFERVCLKAREINSKEKCLFKMYVLCGHSGARIHI